MLTIAFQIKKDGTTVLSGEENLNQVEDVEAFFNKAYSGWRTTIQKAFSSLKEEAVRVETDVLPDKATAKLLGEAN